MDSAVTALWVLHLAVGSLLALHGLAYLALAWQRSRLPRPADPEPAPDAGAAPLVAVQLCVRNEGPLVAEALERCARLDWPRGRLEIQLLDDSDDGSEAANRALVQGLVARGVNVRHVRREGRSGFKAGALQAGLAQTRASVLVPMDVDFAPETDLLVRLISRMAPGVACVQPRWRAGNGDANLVARAQELALDGHFVVEQRVRAHGRTLMSFNSTACAWSRTHIEAAGGWPQSTLAEDLDLATRALLAGGTFVYLEATQVPCLVPDTVGAFARQQARWARGSMQNARLHTRRVLASGLAPGRKAATLHHLWHYSIHPLILGLVATQAALCAVEPQPSQGLVAVSWLLTLFAGVGPLAMYAVALAKDRGLRGLQRLGRLLPLSVFGLGITPRLAVATATGLLSRRTGDFVRTPKARSGWRPETPAVAAALGVLAWAALLQPWGHPLAPGVLAFGLASLATGIWR